MLAVRPIDIQDNFQKICNEINMGETVFISRHKNENIYMISEAEYNTLQKAKRNTEYLAMLDNSFDQLKQGKTISFTMEELKEMESDDWKPTQKVLNWLKRLEQENE